MQYTESKQNSRHSLTHINDKTYDFFQKVNKVQHSIVTTNKLIASKTDTFNVVLNEITGNKDLEDSFINLMADANEDMVYATDLFREIMLIYLSVVFKQFVKDVKDDIKISKHTTHRKEVKERHEKAASQMLTELTLADIVNDASEGKATSFIQLKALIMKNKKYFMCKSWTKEDMFHLCNMCAITVKKNVKKEVINDLLVNFVSSANGFVKHYPLTVDALRKGVERTHSCNTVKQISESSQLMTISVVIVVRSMLKMKNGLIVMYATDGITDYVLMSLMNFGTW